MIDKYDFDDGNGLVPAHKHTNGGGWVADTASVANTVYVGPNAEVYEYAKVVEWVVVTGDAKVFGKVSVSGYALVSENANVFGKSNVFGNAKVYGNARVYGNVKVFGDAMISGNAKVCGDAMVSGDAVVSENDLVYGVITKKDTSEIEDDYKSEATKSTGSKNKEVYNRFDLEQDIFSCWRLVDDIDQLTELIMDRGADSDKISNILIGLSALYGDRFQKLMDNFEEHIANGKI
jgi:carbonic anhydrase/acetyltransferase-like protein (isoleucine patch superfamily)